LFQDILDYHDRKPKRILIVEDNELESSQIAKMLDIDDLVSIEIAATGQQALELIRNQVYDCITIDYMLPDIGGMDFVTEINTLKKTEHDALADLFGKGFFAERTNAIKAVCQSSVVKRCELIGTFTGRSRVAPSY